VESATACGISMATYIATNVQPATGGYVHAVRANLSQPVTDGGVSITSWTGVAATFAQAVGAHVHASGSSDAAVTAAPGPLDVGSGELIYAFTLANGLVGLGKPQGFTDVGDGSDSFIKMDAVYRAPGSAGTAVNPQWTWMFNSPGQPKTWLASAFVVRPIGANPPPVNQPPVAGFTSSCTGLTCNFTSSSTDPDGSIATYAWSFGDGATASTQNPSHSYTVAGSYTVTLTVTDDKGATNSLSRSVAVTAANQPPVAGFTQSCSGLACNFTNTSTDPDGSIASSSWAFGDGATSVSPNPAHSYATGGTYTVSLTVTDNQGATNTTSHSVTVNRPPVASFTFSCSLLACNFTSTSTDPDGPIASYSWSFGNGATSTAQNPAQSYATGGTYTVSLTVKDGQGATNSTTRSVTVNRPPVASFTFSCSLLACNFTSTSSDPDGALASYSWNFGDGTTATSQNSSRTYSTGGTYTVSLTVTDPQGATNTTSKSVTVNRPPTVNAGADQSLRIGLLYNFTWSFTDLDNDGPWSYTIDWGDGTTTTGTRTSGGSITSSHSYIAVLTTRTIKVTVTDSHGATGSDTKRLTLVLL
jgi:PKD repeat protein